MSNKDEFVVDPAGDGMSAEEVAERMAGSAGRRLGIRFAAHQRAEEERLAADETPA